MFSSCFFATATLLAFVSAFFALTLALHPFNRLLLRTKRYYLLNFGPSYSPASIGRSFWPHAYSYGFLKWPHDIFWCSVIFRSFLLTHTWTVIQMSITISKTGTERYKWVRVYCTIGQPCRISVTIILEYNNVSATQYPFPANSNSVKDNTVYYPILFKLNTSSVYLAITIT